MAAAEGGLAKAKYSSGVLYETGLVRAADLDLARLWYSRAAADCMVDAREALRALANPLAATLSAKSEGQRSRRPEGSSRAVIAIAAKVRTKIGCHSFRATGITEYLRNGGKLEIAQQMTNHESSRTTGLYDRRQDQEVFVEGLGRSGRW